MHQPGIVPLSLPVFHLFSVSQWSRPFTCPPAPFLFLLLFFLLLRLLFSCYHLKVDAGGKLKMANMGVIYEAARLVNEKMWRYVRHSTLICLLYSQ